MVKGRDKGIQFEREQSRALSLWLSNGLDKDLFWRSAGSGSKASSGHGPQYGDLCVHKPNFEIQIGFGPSVRPAEEFIANFCVELKFVKDVNPIKVLYNPDDMFLKWWIKNWILAEKFNVKPLLIVKINYVTPFWCLESDEGQNLAMHFNLPYFIIENEQVNICGIPQYDLFKQPWVNIRHHLLFSKYYEVKG